MKDRMFSRRNFLRGAGIAISGAAAGEFPQVLRAASKEVLIGAVQPLTGITAEGGQMATWGLERSEARFSRLFGIPSTGIRTISLEDGKGEVKTTFFHLAEGSVELACHRLPGSWRDSPIRRGPGFHHLAFEVEDFDEALASLAVQGIVPLPRFPFKTPHGRVAFFEPEQTGGILVEICEKEAAVAEKGKEK